MALLLLEALPQEEDVGRLGVEDNVGAAAGGGGAPSRTESMEKRDEVVSVVDGSVATAGAGSGGGSKTEATVVVGSVGTGVFKDVMKSNPDEVTTGGGASSTASVVPVSTGGDALVALIELVILVIKSNPDMVGGSSIGVVDSTRSVRA